MAIQLNPRDPKTYYNRALANSKLSNYEAAISDYGEAIATGNIPQAYLNRGFQKLRTGDQEGAFSDWKKAGEMGFSKAYELLATYGRGQSEIDIQFEIKQLKKEIDSSENCIQGAELE